MLFPRFSPRLWGSLNKVCAGFALRGCLQLCLLLLITTRQSNTHLINVTHSYDCCGYTTVFIFVCVCERVCQVYEHSSYTHVHSFLQCRLNCHCNVCDIKWTKLKLQVPSFLCLFCDFTCTHN